MASDAVTAALASMDLPTTGLTGDTTREEIGLDSLLLEEFVIFLAREHGIEVTADEVHATVTMAELTDLVAAREGGSER